jgi:hypothetical protein
MANKSSKSPSGEDREHDEHIRNHGVEKEDISKNTRPASASASQKEATAKQPNQQNRGFEEDQPGNPVRTTGSTSRDQEILPTGEPDPDES